MLVLRGRVQVQASLIFVKRRIPVEYFLRTDSLVFLLDSQRFKVLLGGQDRLGSLQLERRHEVGLRLRVAYFHRAGDRFQIDL